jgi:hypothetical protein
MLRVALAFLVAMLAVFTAGCSDRDPFVGAWTFDPAQSEIAASDLIFTLRTDGRVHSEGGGTAPYDFQVDGGESVTANGRIVSWVSAGDAQWTMTKSRDGRIVETTRVTLAADQTTLTTAGVGVLPDGSEFTRTTTYRRVSGDTGLFGRWRSVQVDTGATWDGYLISRNSAGDMVWEIPTDHQVIIGRFDGSDLPIKGPGLPPGSTLSARRLSKHQLSITMKVNGAITEHGTVTLSSDGELMTELSWAPGQEDRRSKAVYVRASPETISR